MAKDEEEKEEAGEVEKEERVREYQCHQCGRKYAYMHKLKHHITWLCKERAARLVEVEPRREFSSNIYELPTIGRLSQGSLVCSCTLVATGLRSCTTATMATHRCRGY